MPVITPRPTPADEVIERMLASRRFVATENGEVYHRDIRYKDKRWKPAGWRHRALNRWVFSFEKKKVLRSRFVARWFYGPIPPGFIVHHKDGDSSHDDPMNLDVTKDHDHAREIWEKRLAPLPRSPERVTKWRATMMKRERWSQRQPWNEEIRRRVMTPEYLAAQKERAKLGGIKSHERAVARREK